MQRTIHLQKVTWFEVPSNIRVDRIRANDQEVPWSRRDHKVHVDSALPVHLTVEYTKMRPAPRAAYFPLEASK